MSIHVSASSRSYAVKDGFPITLCVVIGEAQAGGWVIAWDSQHVVAKGEDPLAVVLGQGEAVRNRTIQVVATAVDVRSETNLLSSTLTISGGVSGEQQFVSRWATGNDGDAAVFTTMIEFQ